jgi:hypothetical protein
VLIVIRSIQRRPHAAVHAGAGRAVTGPIVSSTVRLAGSPRLQAPEPHSIVTCSYCRKALSQPPSIWSGYMIVALKEFIRRCRDPTRVDEVLRPPRWRRSVRQTRVPRRKVSTLRAQESPVFFGRAEVQPHLVRINVVLPANVRSGARQVRRDRESLNGTSGPRLSNRSVGRVSGLACQTQDRSHSNNETEGSYSMRRWGSNPAKLHTPSGDHHGRPPVVARAPQPTPHFVGLDVDKEGSASQALRRMRSGHLLLRGALLRRWLRPARDGAWLVDGRLDGIFPVGRAEDSRGRWTSRCGVRK